MTLVNRITPLALALVSTAAFAQVDTATLTGTVKNKKGDAIAHATVRLTSPKLLGERVAKADAKGNFRIPLLPTGTYTIHFTAPGHLANKGSFTLMAGQVLRQDGVLMAEAEVQTQGAVVEVVATTVAAQVDKTETVTQTAMTMEKMQTLNSSSIYTALNFAPGLTPGTGTNANPVFSSIRGGMGAGTATMMNGGNTKSGVKNLAEFDPTIPDMIESMSVIQSPLNAKFGHTSGGVISWTTSRGSNDFSGSIRRTYLRDTWSAFANTKYPNRLGEVTEMLQAAQDIDRGQWQATIKGPIIKDKVTFAFGTKLFPKTRAESRPVKSFSDIPQVTDPQSTYFKDPATGTVYRDSALSPFDGKLMTSETRNKWNQFTLFYQINADHGLEFGQTTQYKSNTRFAPGDNITWYSYGDTAMADNISDRKLWNLAYRGIMGSGVLEARLGSKKEDYRHMGSPMPGVSTWVLSNQIKDPNSGQYRLANNLIEALYGADAYNTFWSGGDGGGDFDSLRTDTANINYQYFLQKAGTHVLDLGMDFMKSTYEDKNVRDIFVRAAGRLSQNYGPGIGGRFIAVPYDATVGDLTGGVAVNYGSIAEQPGTSLLQARTIGGLNFITRMNHNFGADSGNFYTTNVGAYANDMWTLNERHSLMAGARVDKFKVFDDVKTIHTFTTFSPRFEYKWDLEGDQRRVVSASWARFTDTLHAWFFQPYAQAFRGNRTVKLWTGKNPDGTKRPYLVDYADMINPANYNFVQSASVVGGVNNQLDSNVRAPQSTETTLGFRRSFTNGSFYRATLVHKTWKYLSNYAPVLTPTAQALPGLADKIVLPRRFQVDDSLNRTYNSLEVEWNFVFSSRVQLGGNYTYSRLTSNDTSGALENPMGSSGVSALWRDFNNSYVPNSDWEATALVSGGHVMKAWLSTDLSTGKLKQSAVLRGSFTQGSPYSNSLTYNVNRPVVPGYTSTDGLPTSVPSFMGLRGQFRGNDGWNLSLNYNLEVPIYRRLAWFFSAEVNNVLNTIQLAGYTQTAGGTHNWVYDAAGKPTSTVPATLVNGPRGARDTRASESRYGFRTVNVETGIRF